MGVSASATRVPVDALAALHVGNRGVTGGGAAHKSTAPLQQQALLCLEQYLVHARQQPKLLPARLQEVDMALLRLYAERGAADLYEHLRDPRVSLAVEEAEVLLRATKVRRARGKGSHAGVLLGLWHSSPSGAQPGLGRPRRWGRCRNHLRSCACTGAWAVMLMRWACGRGALPGVARRRTPR